MSGQPIPNIVFKLWPLKLKCHYTLASIASLPQTIAPVGACLLLCSVLHVYWFVPIVLPTLSFSNLVLVTWLSHHLNYSLPWLIYPIISIYLFHTRLLYLVLSYRSLLLLCFTLSTFPCVASPTARHTKEVKNRRFALLGLALGIHELGIRPGGSESV